MAVRNEKKQWQAFFDGISNVLQGRQAEIEVLSLKLGDQLAAEWLPFFGITYDPKDDIVEIVLEGMDHLIEKPQQIYADTGGGTSLVSIDIVELQRHDRLSSLGSHEMLPPPASGQ